MSIKKIITYLIGNLFFYIQTFADVAEPQVEFGLPFENWKQDEHLFISKSISEAIKYVGLLAVFAMIVGGLKYILSVGDDGKVKKARDLIIYSIIGVICSGLAYALVSIINKITI